MATTDQTPAGDGSELGRPFMTEEIDGELKTQVLFIPSTGMFYEHLRKGHPDVDPETAITLKDPRSGETFDYEGNLGTRLMQKAVGNHCIGLVNVDKWEDFRETYVEADSSDIERCRQFIDQHLLKSDERDERDDA